MLKEKENMICHTRIKVKNMAEFIPADVNVAPTCIFLNQVIEKSNFEEELWP